MAIAVRICGVRLQLCFSLGDLQCTGWVVFDYTPLIHDYVADYVADDLAASVKLLIWNPAFLSGVFYWADIDKKRG